MYSSSMGLTDEDVGRNVRDLRVERNLTQAALASHVYLDRTAISRLESGRRAVTVPELAAIADVLGVEIGHLVISPEQRQPVPPLPTLQERSIWRPDYSAMLSQITAGVQRLRSSFVREVGVREVGVREVGVREIGARESGTSVASTFLTGSARYMLMGLASTLTTIVTLIAIWTLLLGIWFEMLGMMVDFQRLPGESTTGSFEMIWTLLVILGGTSLTGAAAYVLTTGIRGLSADLVAHLQSPSRRAGMPIYATDRLSAEPIDQQIQAVTR